MWWVGIFFPVLHSPMLDYGLMPLDVTFSYLSVNGFTSYGTDVSSSWPSVQLPSIMSIMVWISFSSDGAGDWTPGLTCSRQAELQPKLYGLSF